jgi:hypothetical protein
MGCFFMFTGFPDFLLGPAFDTIARKPEHDKATWPARDNCGLELRHPDCHCLTYPPVAQATGD